MIFNNTLHIPYLSNILLSKYFNNAPYLHNRDIFNGIEIDLNEQTNNYL